MFLFHSSQLTVFRAILPLVLSPTLIWRFTSSFKTAHPSHPTHAYQTTYRHNILFSSVLQPRDGSLLHTSSIQ